VPGRAVLGKQDVFTCSKLHIPTSGADADQLYVKTALHQNYYDQQPELGMQLYQALLLDCDASFWQLTHIENLEHACIANTFALRAACNHW
jgi:hypothetical protein